jgi:hypothetical protein
MLRIPLSLAAMALVGFVSSHGHAAQATVYKCFDAKLNVVYTDQPCRGERLDIELGSVDHARVEELAREREAVSRAIAQRIAEGHRAQLAREYAPPVVYAGPPAVGNEAYFPAWGWFGPGFDDRRGGRGEHARPPASRHRSPPSVPASRGDLIRR